MNTGTWGTPPSVLELNYSEVHVFRVSLNQTETITRQLRQTLAPDERQRAGRYYRDRDRKQFIIARAILRQLISRYLCLPPANLTFTYNQYGRPFLSDDPNRSEINFNLSHSGDWALYAFTRGRSIGIDIEMVREEFATLEIATQFFSPDEVTVLKSLPGNLRPQAFFNCWTRKESYIKALGEGLSHPLDRFSVSLKSDEKAALLKVDGDEYEPLRWAICDLQPSAGYVAAVAVEHPPFTLRMWNW